MARFLAYWLLIWSDIMVKQNLPVRGVLREMKALAFLHDMLPISGVVNVDGVELDVRVKSVFVRENGATGEVGNEEVIQEALVWKVLVRFL